MTTRNNTNRHGKTRTVIDGVKAGDRVRDVQRVDWRGTVLRIETYPGTGNQKWATVAWDWAMSARRADLASLKKVVVE
jgi:hypothetical protein